MTIRTEKQLLAECVYKEARGEGSEGMRAVAHVICNRVKSPAFPNTLTKVIMQRNAFTSMSVPSDPQFMKPCPLPDDPHGVVWADAQVISEKVLRGDDEDISCHACYYANVRDVSSGWFQRQIVGKPNEHPITAKVKKHTFFR